MSALTFIEGVGPASKCDACGLKQHAPVPARYVWHHILPKTCGGLSGSVNLVESCDTGHYAIHDLMWRLANAPDSIKGRRYTRRQRDLAARGYREAMAAGTAGKIPREA